MRRSRGVTLAELITVIAIVAILAAVALPMARFAIRRQKEMDLRYRLQKICNSIDAYHDLRVRGVIKEPPSLGQGDYPKTLDELTKPIELIDGKKVLFLRPSDLIDPMTGHADWRTIASTDDPDATTSDGDNVWDIRSSSDALSLDGKTKYSDW